MADSSQRYDYELAAREPDLWLGHARRLWRAARAVHREFAHHYADLRALADAPEEDLALFGPYLLLSGMAIENLLKGALLQQRPELVRDSQLLMSGLGGGSGHNLLAMARAVSPTLGARYADLLGRLPAHVLWGGRYPVPRKAEHFIGQARAGGPDNLRSFRTSDPAALEALFDELADTMTRGAAHRDIRRDL